MNTVVYHNNEWGNELEKTISITLNTEQYMWVNQWYDEWTQSCKINDQRYCSSNQLDQCSDITGIDAKK